MDLRNCSEEPSASIFTNNSCLQYSTFIIIGNVHYLLNMINSEFIRGIDKKKSADQLLWGSAGVTTLVIELQNCNFVLCKTHW